MVGGEDSDSSETESTSNSDIDDAGDGGMGASDGPREEEPPEVDYGGDWGMEPDDDLLLSSESGTEEEEESTSGTRLDGIVRSVARELRAKQSSTDYYHALRMDTETRGVGQRLDIRTTVFTQHMTNDFRLTDVRQSRNTF